MRFPHHLMFFAVPSPGFRFLLWASGSLLFQLFLLSFFSLLLFLYPGLLLAVGLLGWSLHLMTADRSTVVSPGGVSSPLTCSLKPSYLRGWRRVRVGGCRDRGWRGLLGLLQGMIIHAFIWAAAAVTVAVFFTPVFPLLLIFLLLSLP